MKLADNARALVAGSSRWPTQKLILPISLLLGVGLCWQLAQTTWLLLPLPQPEVSGTTRGAPIVSQVQNRNQGPTLSSVASSSLFGKADATAKTARPEPKPIEPIPDDIPKTTLNLKLFGIITYDDQGNGSAVIQGSGKQKHYSNGDQIKGSGSVVLHSVYADKVILSRNGKLEALELSRKLVAKNSPSTSKNRSSSTSSNNSNARVIDKRGDSSLTNDLAGIKQKLSEDPLSVINLIRATPVFKSGQLQGFRVSPGSDRQLFRRAGLRRNDLVTNINGVQLDDQQKALGLLADIQQASELSISVERNGRPLQLTFSLTN